MIIYGCKNKGFTLIEMMVAIAILSLIMLATVTALRTLAKTQHALDYKSNRISEMRAVTSFLRRNVGQAVTIALSQRKHPGVMYFEGSEEEVSWAAPMPIPGGTGGLSALKLGVNDDKQLVVLIQPFTEALEWEELVPTILVEDVESLAISYKTETGEWVNAWDPYALLKKPSHVKVTLQVEAKYWPEIIIALTGQKI